MAQTRRSSGANRRSESGEASRTVRGRTRQGMGEERSTRSAQAGLPESEETIASQGESEPTAAHIEQLQSMATEMAPQLGAAAAAAIATAVILPEFLPAVLIGAGATLAPKLLPGVGYTFRPLLKTLIRAGYATFSTVQHLAAEAGEQMQDVIAEVQAEHAPRSEGGPRAAPDQTEAGAAH